MTDTKTVYTHFPPTEANEHEVVAATRVILAASGAQAALSYLHKTYLKEGRTGFVTAGGNLLMTELKLLTDDAEGYHHFRNAALDTGDCSMAEKLRISQMFAVWTQVMGNWKWLLPYQWRLKQATRVLKHDFPAL